MADTSLPAPEESTTYLNRLKQGEQHVLWKLSLRILICILDIISIGTSAWVLSNALKFRSNPYIGYFTGPEVSPWILIVCSVSFIFCLICILVLLLRKPPRPAHPGIAVGIDLILWLAFIVTALFATAAIFSLASFGNDGDSLSDPSYGSSSYSGEYYLAPNNTWVYNITNVYTDYSTTSTCTNKDCNGYFFNTTRYDWQLNTTTPSTSSVHRECSDFDSCQQQDAYINMLWRTKNRRFGTEVVVGAVQWLCVLLHFVLFVWACVDTHRRNRGVKQRKVNAVADRVIQDMQARGLITVHDPARAGPEGQSLMGREGGGTVAAGPSAR